MKNAGMWPSGSSRLGVLGNPENRRVQEYLRVADQMGRRPVCFSWRDWLRNPRRLPVDRLRIESPGEDPEVAALLIEAGGGPPGVRLEHGEIAYLAEYHRGFCRALELLQQPCQNSAAEISLMFDKWACHQLFTAAGLARPVSQPARPELLQAPWGRLFLKPLHGSSASGVCALRWRGERRQLIAPIELAGGKLYNTLKVRTYQNPRDIAQILECLLPQGMIAEQWIPKLCLAGGSTDLRVLVIGGEARHRVVRQSQSPMTNLHLGNRRGCEEELGERLEPALRLAERAAACFPGCLYAGVDILLDLKGRALIGEINAFGDLLPNLKHRGECAYEAILRREIA
jgi:glutathione synthase/RimK-type ligase-like ATP-grasp enzyme